MATSGSCSLTQRRAGHPVTPVFPGRLRISREKNRSEKKGVSRSSFDSEKCAARLPKPNPLECYKEKKDLQKICSGVSGFFQTTACWDTAPAPSRGLQCGIPLGGAWRLLTALLQKSCLDLGTKRAKKSSLGPPPQDHVVHKASSLFRVIQG